MACGGGGRGGVAMAMASSAGGNIKRGARFSVRLVARRCYVTGVTLPPILPMLPHHPRGAVCGSIETSTNFLAQGWQLSHRGWLS